MSERLPYEEQLNQQWNELPLPDENKAWEDMKRRLDDDDDAAPPAWWDYRGCGLWGWLLLGMLALGWWLLRPEKWLTGKKKEQESSVQQQGDSINNKTPTKNTIVIESRNDEKKIDSNSVLQKGNDSIKEKTPDTRTSKIAAGNETTTTEVVIKVKPARTGKGKPTRPVNVPVNKNRPTQSVISMPGETSGEKQKTVVPIQADNPLTNTTGKNEPDKPDKPVITNNNTSLVKTIDSDTLKKTTEPEVPTVKIPSRKDSAKTKATFFSGGISVNQQLPIDGQTGTPYNSLGRKGTLLDYIPSVYFRFNKLVNNKDKWFVQAELRYGAPQYTKDLVYGQSIVPDTGNNAQYSTVTSSILKKTYYHQLPITFNYFVLPNWSVGGGFVWNRFSSAIGEKEIRRKHNVLPGLDTFVGKTVIKKIADSSSAFSKSYFQAVIESQYKWKRFSLGARYAFGLNPYIRFTLPGGTQQQEKNSSLQIFLRYQLWKSRLRVKPKR